MLRDVQVLSRKYDGSLRDAYEAYLYSVTEERIIVFSPPGTNAFDHRKQAWFPAEDGLLENYSLRKWYHVWHICERLNNSTNKIYVHIAQPATFAEGILRWTDLDLDFRVQADGTIVLLDEDEFEQNAKCMRYPQSVIEQCRSVCQEVEAGLKSRRGLFDHEAQVELYHHIKGKAFARG